MQRSIDDMRSNLAAPLTVDVLAQSAMFSKYHFTRMFRQVTGTTPRRFLSAMRLAEAKRLLRSTDAPVADVGNAVGFSGTGTFSTRFRASVGMSPSVYRVRGTEPPPPGETFVGLFPSRIMEGIPVRAVMLKPGEDPVLDIPPGRWHALAYGAANDGTDFIDTVAFVSGPTRGFVRLRRPALRPVTVIDPPVLLGCFDPDRALVPLS